MSLTANKIAVAMFGVAAGGYKTDITNFLTANGAVATVAALLPASGLNPSFLGQPLYNNQQFAEALVAKMMPGLSPAVASAAAGQIVSYMTANPAKSRAEIIVDLILAIDAIPPSDPVFGAVAASFDQKVALAEAYTGTSTDLAELAQVIGNQPPGQQGGQTFTLTTGADYADSTSSIRNGGLLPSDFKFTSQSETVVAAAGTLTGLDSLIDPSTTDNDVLNATVTALVTPALQNIETINLTVNTAGAGLNFATVTGAKVVTLTGSANAKLAAIDATSAPTIEINNYTKVATLEAATLAGTKDALTVKVSGMTGSATVIPGITLTASAAGDLETFNLESAGTSKNTVALTTAGGNVNAVNKSVLTGAADLDLRVAHGLINGQTLDASGHKGVLNLIVDRNGAGTATTNLTNVSGVDTYTFRDSAAPLDALVVSGLVNNANVVLTYSTGAGLANSLAVKGAASGTSDVVNLLLDHVTDATDIAVGGLNINDVETINITSEGGTAAGNSITALTVSAGSNVTVDGSTKLDLQLAATSTVSSVTVKGSGNHKVDFAGAVTYNAKNLTIDGSAATGKLTLDGSDFKGTAGGAVETLTILGGSNDDTITGTNNADAKNVIDAGAGKDVVNVTTANSSTVTLGAGADELKINGVTGVSFVTITDFALGSGGDKLSVDTFWPMTFGGVGATSVNNQLVIINVAVANDGAAALAVSAAAAEAAIIVINNASGVAELWYDADGAGGGEVKLAVFENITTVGTLTNATTGFIAANFGTWN